MIYVTLFTYFIILIIFTLIFFVLQYIRQRNRIDDMNKKLVIQNIDRVFCDIDV